MPHNHRGSSRNPFTQDNQASGRPKLPQIMTPRAPTPFRPAATQPFKPQMPAANVMQRQTVKPVGPVPAQINRGGIARNLVTNSQLNRHAPPTAQAKLAQPRAPQHQGLRTALTPQTLVAQRQARPNHVPGARPPVPTRAQMIGIQTKGVASPFRSKCGCGPARVSNASPCGCHGGPGANSTLQLAKKKGQAQKPKTPKWMKTWRNLKCYARDTALAMEKHMVGPNEIEDYLKAFLATYSDGVRGHCSEAVQADAQPSAHTEKDLEVFHSYHREHKPYGRRK